MGQTGPVLGPGAFSICNADKMEIPERICKSSAGVIGFVAANDESDRSGPPPGGRVIFRVFVSPVSTFFRQRPGECNTDPIVSEISTLDRAISFSFREKMSCRDFAIGYF